MSRIETRWLEAQAEDAVALRRDAYLFDLIPGAGGRPWERHGEARAAEDAAPGGAPNEGDRRRGPPPRQYLLGMRCSSVARRAADGEIVDHNLWGALLQFPVDYLRRADPARVVVWLQGALWHPNCAPDLGLLCLGRLTPGTPLRDLVFRVHEILVYANWASHSALNQAAAAWARQNQHRFPTDPRPLLWRPPPPSTLASNPGSRSHVEP